MDYNLDLFQNSADFSAEMSSSTAEALHRPYRLYTRSFFFFFLLLFFSKYRLERFFTSSAQPSGFSFFFSWAFLIKHTFQIFEHLPPRLHAPGRLVQLFFPLFGLLILTNTSFDCFFLRMISQQGVNWYWFYVWVGISHFLFLLLDLITNFYVWCICRLLPYIY